MEHLEPFRLGTATADVLLKETSKAVQDLPLEDLTDGPNVMKKLKEKKKKETPRNCTQTS